MKYRTLGALVAGSVAAGCASTINPYSHSSKYDPVKHPLQAAYQLVSEQKFPGIKCKNLEEKVRVCKGTIQNTPEIYGEGMGPDPKTKYHILTLQTPKMKQMIVGLHAAETPGTDPPKVIVAAYAITGESIFATSKPQIVGRVYPEAFGDYFRNPEIGAKGFNVSKLRIVPIGLARAFDSRARKLPGYVWGSINTMMGIVDLIEEKKEEKKQKPPVIKPKPRPTDKLAKK